MGLSRLPESVSFKFPLHVQYEMFQIFPTTFAQQTVKYFTEFTTASGLETINIIFEFSCTSIFRVSKLVLTQSSPAEKAIIRDTFVFIAGHGCFW